MKLKEQKGIALLYSLIVISVAVGVGLSVFSLIYGGFPLADIIVNSQKAFYAADAGAECALYWDINQKAFSPPFSSIYCMDPSNPVIVNYSSPNGEDHFDFNLNLQENKSCIDVSIVKKTSGNTKITSSGHSPCSPGSKNRAERTLEINY